MARLHIIGSHANWAAYSNQLSLTLLTLVSLYGVEITEQMIDGAMMAIKGNAESSSDEIRVSGSVDCCPVV